MPWEETEEYIRSAHESTDNYDRDSLRTIEIDADQGIKAIVGCPKGHFRNGRCNVGTQVLSYLFAKNKGWNTAKAKEWFEKSEKRGHRK